jgi:hypothetical protein
MGDEEIAEISELAPAASKRITWSEDLAVALPFLVSDEDGNPHEALPPEKENRKIVWSDEIELCEMPNRKQLGLTDDYSEEDEEDVDYEIEIVEDDGDADFYLEIVDGEIFYVFETEDGSDEEDESDSDDDSAYSSAKAPLQLDLSMMLAPALGDDDDERGAPTLIFEDEDDALPTEIHIGGLKKHGKEEEQEMELDPLQFEATGRAELVTEDNADDINLVPDEQEKLQGSFHESFHASSGSLMFASPEASPESSPVTAAKQMVEGFSSPIAAPKVPAVCPNSVESATSKKSILKIASSPSSHVKKKIKPKKKEKGTVTKTYVRADTFDGEHSVFTWEKPTWTTESKLKETGVGDDIRKGGNLAAPITFPKQKKKTDKDEKNDVYEDEYGNVIDKAELVRRIEAGDTGAMAFVPRPTYGGRYQRKLKCSIQGQKIRSGVALEMSITMATVNRQRADINLEAQPDKVLTKHVEVVRQEYKWEQPEWAKASRLKSTDNGSMIKTGGAMEAPVTNIRDWSRASLKSTGGSMIKTGGAVEAPVTNIRASLKSTGGSLIKAGDGVRNIIEIQKEYTWEQPEWAKKKLTSTSAGNTLKSGSDLQKPITHIQRTHSSDDLTPRRSSKMMVKRSQSFEEPPPPRPPLSDDGES